jgi:hypothetical protein
MHAMSESAFAFWRLKHMPHGRIAEAPPALPECLGRIFIVGQDVVVTSAPYCSAAWMMSVMAGRWERNIFGNMPTGWKIAPCFSGLLIYLLL